MVISTMPPKLSAFRFLGSFVPVCTIRVTKLVAKIGSTTDNTKVIAPPKQSLGKLTFSFQTVSSKTKQINTATISQVPAAIILPMLSIPY